MLFSLLSDQNPLRRIGNARQCDTQFTGTQICARFVRIYKRVCTRIYGVYQKRIYYMCVKNTPYTRPKDTYMRLKCLVKNIHWIRAHISRTHFETNGQPYDITGKYLYVKFPRRKTLRCKNLKIYIKISLVQSSPTVQSSPVQSSPCFVLCLLSVLKKCLNKGIKTENLEPVA